MNGCRQNESSNRIKKNSDNIICVFVTLLLRFWIVLAFKRSLICADFSPESDQNTFSLEEALLWIIKYSMYFI